MSNCGSQIPESSLIFTSTCPLKVQISQGLDPFFQIELLKPAVWFCDRDRGLFPFYYRIRSHHVASRRAALHRTVSHRIAWGGALQSIYRSTLPITIWCMTSKVPSGEVIQTHMASSLREMFDKKISCNQGAWSRVRTKV